MQVALIDTSEEQLGKALRGIQASLERLAGTKKLQDDPGEILSRLNPTTDMEVGLTIMVKLIFFSCRRPLKYTVSKCEYNHVGCLSSGFRNRSNTRSRGIKSISVQENR